MQKQAIIRVRVVLDEHEDEFDAEENVLAALEDAEIMAHVQAIGVESVEERSKAT